jgi:hypothetical protein
MSNVKCDELLFIVRVRLYGFELVGNFFNDNDCLFVVWGDEDRSVLSSISFIDRLSSSCSTKRKFSVCFDFNFSC